MHEIAKNNINKERFYFWLNKEIDFFKLMPVELKKKFKTWRILFI